MNDGYIPDAGWHEYPVLIPGHYRSEPAYLDIETRKVPVPPPGYHRLKTGEPLTRRWQAFLAGVARGSYVIIVESLGDEREFLNGVAEAVGTAPHIVYQATRKFDEMILKGRYTYARRGPEDIPFYPAMPGAEDMTWVCYRFPERPRRSQDCESKDVPALYAKRGQSRDTVLVHLLRDVVELILQVGQPDQECERWCRRVMASYSFAWSQVYSVQKERP